jgi:hypothetical protein
MTAKKYKCTECNWSGVFKEMKNEQDIDYDQYCCPKCYNVMYDCLLDKWYLEEEPKQETLEVIIGKKATDYCEKYKGTDKYNVAMLAIEFGYQLFETRHNYEKKHTYSKIEKL